MDRSNFKQYLFVFILVILGILLGILFYLAPKTAEYIVLDFNILPTGATFEG